MTGNQEMASLLNNYFSSVFTIEIDYCSMPETVSDLNSDGCMLETVELTQDIVCKKLLTLKPNKTPDVDSISPRFLNENAAKLSLPILHLFNESLHGGVVPCD